jgi:threonine dehydratase
MITLEQIKQARLEYPSVIRLTPLVVSDDLSEHIGASVWLKCENLQVTGAYKPRAAFTLLDRLSDEQKRRGAALSSSGNFASAFAYMGRLLGIPTAIVMMQKTSPLKAEKTNRYGGEIVWCENRFEARFETLKRLEAERGLTVINTLEEPNVPIGHGTAGLEIVEQLPNADMVLVPISTGGLIAGVATALKESNPRIKVIGVQPEGSNAAYLSYRAGKVVTIAGTNSICDGLTATRPGELMFAHIQRYVDDIVLVGDEDIKAAVAWLAEHDKLVVEPSGAVGVAALMTGKVKASGNVVALLSGGNILPSLLAEILTKH